MFNKICTKSSPLVSKPQRFRLQRTLHMAENSGFETLCTPHRPFVKSYRGVKRKKLYGDYFKITIEPVIVKKYRKTHANRGFYKKKLDTLFDTHCIKTGVQLWWTRRGSNPRPLRCERSALPAEPRAHVFKAEVIIPQRGGFVK